MNETKDKLERLADLHDAVALLRAEYEQAKEAAVPPMVKAALAGVDEEFLERLTEAESRLVEMETEVKAEVAAAGQTMAANGVRAVWVKGRVTWDAKSLDGYALTKPELFAFRREGEPSVRLQYGH